MAPPLAAALAAGPVVLDGGLATQLAAVGHDVSGALWSARLLRDDPAAVVAAHAAYFGAGARVATTASYQATVEGFAAAGVDRATALHLIASSVRLARRAADEAGLADAAWVAGSVGPYGAALADGSEYTGAYLDPAWTGRTSGGLTEAGLRAFHRPRLEALAGAGADVLALETLPGAAEVTALLAELPGLGVPAWLSLTVVRDADGEVRTRRGEPATEVFALAGAAAEVVAVGVNCTDPATATAAVAVAAAASGKPVVVYPNSGERWDPVRRCWAGPGRWPPALAGRWVAAGARLVGGCCRVGPEAVRALAAALAVTAPREPRSW